MCGYSCVHDLLMIRGEKIKVDIYPLFSSRIDNEFIQVPKNCTVEEGDSISLMCEHRFGLAYNWIADRGAIDTLDSKVELIVCAIS